MLPTRLGTRASERGRSVHVKTAASLLFVVAVEMLCACGGAAPAPASRRPDAVPLPGLDHGFEQSPINIDTRQTALAGEHTITLHFRDEVNKVENLGHTVQLDFEEGSHITLDGTRFEFKQCHFHTPSEHHIDGAAFPLEMHIVNVQPDAPQDAPQYLVIAVLFEEGAPNAFLAEFLGAIPKQEQASAELRPGAVKLVDLFGTIPREIKGNYYAYRGSLTTPPYTEAVRWFIAKHIFEASAEQIAALAKIEGNNARHVQALYGRPVDSR